MSFARPVLSWLRSRGASKNARLEIELKSNITPPVTRETLNFHALSTERRFLVLRARAELLFAGYWETGKT